MFRGVPHGDAEAGCFQHGDVVVGIAAGNALRDALVQEPAVEEAVEETAVLETMEGTV